MAGAVMKLKKTQNTTLDNFAERREMRKSLTDIQAKIREKQKEEAKHVIKLTEEQIAKSKMSSDGLKLWASELKNQIKELKRKGMDTYTIKMDAELSVVESELRKRSSR